MKPYRPGDPWPHCYVTWWPFVIAVLLWLSTY